MTDLHDLLRDAVDDIEPTDRLAELRTRTASPARAAARPWFWAAGATVLATAAAVAVVAVVGDGPDAPGHHHDDMAMDPPASTQLVPAYFVGDAPGGEGRLYREFEEVASGEPLQRALERIEHPAADPDYRTTWTPGSFESATLGDGTIEVELGDAGLPAPDGIAAQQVVYTLQGALGQRLPVQFVDDGRPVGDSYQAAPSADVLNPVSISDPAEGNSYAGAMEARGRAEASVHWELQDPSRQTVREGRAAAPGSGPGLRPWSVRVDLAGLAPGSYTFVVVLPDPSGGAELSLLDHDTRTITVR
ncbi:Gmad2 immunoglobulin-like domain-containing protein [Nocardioides conyzicola]|uniref:GerMN domain-containing protein n=1 Tax=Nocardioides conyzicola TaxID=1651781 RepID=A0ABP8WSB0_9ACTN